MAGNCPKCGGVFKDWDLVCPHCGTALFTPQAPADSRKASVALPSWEMQPVRPRSERSMPPPRPALARTPPPSPSSSRIPPPPAAARAPVEERPAEEHLVKLASPPADVAPDLPLAPGTGEAVARRIEIPSMPQALVPLAREAAGLAPPPPRAFVDEPTRVWRSPMEGAIGPDGRIAVPVADGAPDEVDPEDVISADDVEVDEPGMVREAAPRVAPIAIPREAPSSRASAVPLGSVATPQQPLMPGFSVRQKKRKRQDTMPVQRPILEEATHPRIHAQAAGGGEAQPDGQADSRAAGVRNPDTDPMIAAPPGDTLTVDGYDPERLKRILALAQARAATKSRAGGGFPVSIIIGVIAALTILGIAVVIAVFG